MTHCGVVVPSGATCSQSERVSTTAEHWLVRSEAYEEDFYKSYFSIVNVYAFEYKVKACAGAVLIFR